MLHVDVKSLDLLPNLAGLGFEFRLDKPRRRERFTVFFTVRDEDAEFLSARPEAIVPFAGILALAEGVDLDLGGMEVDPVLLRGVRSGVAETARWHGGLRVPRIEGATETEGEVAERVAKTGVFFSGGVDSMFLALRHRPGGFAETVSPIAPATHAIHIYHTEDPVPAEAFRTLDALADTAGKLGLRLLPVQSNLMTANRRLHDRWSDLGHGAGLSTVLQVLSGGLGTGIIGSTHVWGGLVPWGSNPIVDPLWSGRRMRVIHDDAAFGRVEKTRRIADVPGALHNLDVCDIRIDGKGYENCSGCPKCLRTMVTLDLFGVAGPSTAPNFDWSTYGPEKFAGVFLRTSNEAAFATEIRDAAEAHQRTDIVSACDTALRRGRRLRPLARLENMVKASSWGVRHRRALISQRRRLYRALGWATKAN